MKTIPRFLMVLAAGALLTGVAQAQDKTAVHQGMSTNAPANALFSLTLSPAPTLPFGPDAQATGLLVDLQPLGVSVRRPAAAGHLGPTCRPAHG